MVKDGSQKINVLQFICPLGFYGAERWVVALANNSTPEQVRCDLAVTQEGEYQNLDIVEVYPKDIYSAYKIEMNGSFDLKVIQKLVALIKQHDIHIVHTHGYKSDIIGYVASKIAGVKCISTPHGFGEPSSRKLAYFVKLGKFFLRFMDAVVPLSRQLEREVLDCGVSKSKVAYIQNGVDLTELDDFVIDHDSKNEGEGLVVGFAGQMIPRKNIKDLLDIFDALWREDQTIRLQLLGDGEDRPELEVYAKSLASASAIEFLGFRSDRLEIMKRFDLFAMTSRDEGIPRCLMEAMAMQLPVAAYDIQGIDQLVTHEDTGLLSPFGDKGALAKEWKKILSDRKLSKQLGQNARQFVLDNFSAKRMAEEYKDLYLDLLSETKS